MPYENNTNSRIGLIRNGGDIKQKLAYGQCSAPHMFVRRASAVSGGLVDERQYFSNCNGHPNERCDTLIMLHLNIMYCAARLA